MRPKKPETTGQGDLFRARLDQIINMKHELVQLGAKILDRSRDRPALQREGPAGDQDPVHHWASSA